MRLTTSCTLEDLEVECTHCGVKMTGSVGGGGTVRYFQCPRCQRWVSSMYPEVFAADAKVRARASAEAASRTTTAGSGAFKDRLHQWLKSLERETPYGVLGCEASDPDAVIRERYRALARAHHPDAGGDEAQMRRVNEAFEAIVALRRSARAAAATQPLTTSGW